MMRSLTDVIPIDDCTFLARGSLRDVYVHPDDDTVLIKVIRRDMIGDDGHPSDSVGKRERPWGVYLAFRRELDEYMVCARRRIGDPAFRYPFSRPLGLVETTHGLGLLVERIGTADAPAPTLAQLNAEGRLTQAHLATIDRFFDYCAAHHVVLGDVHLGNLVLDPADPGRAICIDGFGEKTLIPAHRYSRRLNRRALERKREKLHRAVAAASDA